MCPRSLDVDFGQISENRWSEAETDSATGDSDQTRDSAARAQF